MKEGDNRSYVRGSHAIGVPKVVASIKYLSVPAFTLVYSVDPTSWSDKLKYWPHHPKRNKKLWLLSCTTYIHMVSLLAAKLRESHAAHNLSHQLPPSRFIIVQLIAPTPLLLSPSMTSFTGPVQPLTRLPSLFSMI